MQNEQADPAFDQPHSVAYAAGFFALAAGVTAMIGWIAGVQRLIDWEGNGITIKFNPSLAIAMLGAALLFRAGLPQKRIVVRALAATAALIGFATLLEHHFGLDFGIDTLFVNEAPGALATASPGRMGTPAATSLTFLGIALLLSTTAYHRFAPKAAIVSLLYSSLSLVGYAFSADALFMLPRLTGIALQASVAIFALSIGVIALHSQSWPMTFVIGSNAGSKTFRKVFPLMILVALVVGYMAVVGQEAGLYDLRFGSALRTLVEIIAYAFLLWWAARSLAAQEIEAAQLRRMRTENDARRRIAAAQEAERRRLARDLHDHLGQQITSIRLRLKHFIDEANRKHPDLAFPLTEIETVAEVLDRDVSLLAWELRPVSLDKEGLRSSLDNFVTAWGKTYGLETEFYSPVDFPRFRPEIELNLYRIVQEALNNSLKHASANRVSVSLVLVENSIRIAVEDDGKGFSPDDTIHHSFAEGLGVSGMYERASLIGGKLEIDSSPDKGTTVYATVPVEVPTPPRLNGSSDEQREA